MSRPFPIRVKRFGRPVASPTAGCKSTVVAPLPGVVTPADLDDRTACALWLGNLLGRIFPVADVYPGHVANYRAWKAEYGR